MTTRATLRASIRKHSGIVARLRIRLVRKEISKQEFEAARQRAEDKFINTIMGTKQ